MEIKELIDKVEAMDYPQKLDKSYDGSCPCFCYSPIIKGKRVKIEGHCWRACTKCNYNGLHIKGNLPEKDLMRIAKAFKKQLDKQKWYSDYEIVIERHKLISKAVKRAMKDFGETFKRLANE